MRIAKKYCLLIVLAAILVESLSASIFYRYYAAIHERFQPAGSATFALAERLFTRFSDGREHLRVQSDHGPLFIPDSALGYVMVPGSYVITEQFNDHIHTFHLSVDDLRRRVTAVTPVKADKHLYVTGDSLLYGWGLNDQETIPWLLQERLPQYEVVNMAVNFYGTIHTLIQLRAIVSHSTVNDALILHYHPVSNELNVLTQSMMATSRLGIEHQLSDATEMLKTAFPFGKISDDGTLAIQSLKLSCATKSVVEDCKHPTPTKTESYNVTKMAFANIIALWPGTIFIAVTGVSNDDPVVQYLRTQKVILVDLRSSKDEPDIDDIIPTDLHDGPFFTYNLFLKLFTALEKNGITH